MFSSERLAEATARSGVGSAGGTPLLAQTKARVAVPLDGGDRLSAAIELKRREVALRRTSLWRGYSAVSETQSLEGATARNGLR
jgi:hypothetical protein